MWDDRYAVDEYVYGTSPNTFLAEHYQQLPKGKVLCLAEGEGRNAVFLAEQGYDVTAVDNSAVGLEKAQKLAQQRGVAIETVVADLAHFDLGQSKWDGIVSIFCHLPPAMRQGVHAQIANALKPNGIFLLEAYCPKQLEYKTGGPQVVEMTVSLENLENEIQGLDCLMMHETERDVSEGTFHSGLGAVVQLIAKR
ncbi:cyclopropane-fatty-acyl-phospholipid synthase family protein [Hydrogenovibrio sp. JE_KL2]|uniref:SAM-dependent methyltransferase n=1 Tax=Hydrogenovibrio sp. JE_KL2 TaxID=2651188 RepID=UPI00128CADBE|nr:class I SAM-dependent methyltransferase [Hydrogenovibrio sp. JE_KL2]MPQ75820.1 class I SAM-dependent methyltransferase [Hydrogenovibrio sp. JE_KL2]